MPKCIVLLAAAIALSGCVGYIGPRGAVLWPGPMIDTREPAQAAPEENQPATAPAGTTAP